MKTKNLIAKVVLLALANLSSQAFGQSFVELLKPGDPLGTAQDLSRFSWNTNLAVPASGNSVSYEFDIATGLPKRVSDSFGPLYTARAATLGSGHLSINASVTNFEFEAHDGLREDNGDIAIPITTPLGPGLQTNLTKSSALVTQVSASYGLLDTLDVSVAIPVITNNFSGQFIVTSGSTTLGQSDVNKHALAVGDMLVGLKWIFLKRASWSLGTQMNFWLPTGDAENIIGLNDFRAEPLIVASTRGYPVNLHANFGFNIGDTSKLRNEFHYKIGIDWPALPKLTLFTEILGRYVINNNRMLITSSPEFIKHTSSLQTDGTAGMKINVAGLSFVYASLIYAIDDTGSRDPLTGTVGLEFNF